MSLASPLRPGSITEISATATVTAANATHESVLTDLAWETLANELEDWLDAGHPAPLRASLEERPAGEPPAHLQRRMVNLTTRLAAALGEMRAEQGGIAQSLKATAHAQRMTSANRGATAAYLDTGA